MQNSVYAWSVQTETIRFFLQNESIVNFVFLWKECCEDAAFSSHQTTFRRVEVKTEAADKKDRRGEGEWRRERRAYSLTAEHNVLSCPLSSRSLSPAHGREDCTQLFTASRDGKSNALHKLKCCIIYMKTASFVMNNWCKGKDFSQ